MKTRTPKEKRYSSMEEFEKAFLPETHKLNMRSRIEKKAESTGTGLVQRVFHVAYEKLSKRA